MKAEEKIQKWVDQQIDKITLPEGKICSPGLGEDLRSQDLIMFADLTGCVDIRELFIDDIAQVPSGL